jgi:hypothetical protein
MDRFGGEAMLFVEIRFFGKSHRHLGRTDGAAADTNLFQFFLLSRRLGQARSTKDDCWNDLKRFLHHLEFERQQWMLNRIELMPGFARDIFARGFVHCNIGVRRSSGPFHNGTPPENGHDRPSL